MTRKNYLLALFLIFFCKLNYAQKSEDNISVLFWNLENFFDYVDEGGGEADKEFSPTGAKRWGKRKFYAKCNAIVKTLLWISDEYGKMPDVMGFAEVENSFVLRNLLKQAALKRQNYGIVHYDSKDVRGIDVALLYNKKVFEYLYSEAFPIVSEGDSLKTRDILLVTLKKHKDDQRYNFIVNHHPSKYSGVQQTQHKRDAAIKTLSKIVQNILGFQSPSGLESPCVSEEKIIAMGDFNDKPDALQMKLLEGILYSKTKKFQEMDVGTIRYQGKWELIDFFLTSFSLLDKTEMFILSPSFLLEWDNTHSGFRPLRTYSGPRYRGGVSDHLPILLLIF